MADLRVPSLVRVQLWLFLAGVLGATGVGLGAYGAHGLDKRLDALLEQDRRMEFPRSPDDVRAWRAKRHSDWDTAVKYHLAHALAVAFLALAAARWPTPALHLAAAAFVIGITLFSGILYIQSATTVSGLGVMVMMGGITLIFGWLAIGAAAFGLREI